MTSSFILASTSTHRQRLLLDAGLQFDMQASEIDERAVENSLEGSGTGPEDLALILAETKATDVAARNPGRLVLGCDQTLSLDGEVLHKPADMEAARRRLLQLSGRRHELNSAVVAVRDTETVWRHVGVARVRFRRLDPGFIGRHLARVGDRALTSVGAYQIEGEGIQLIEEIEGDFFTIVGLPLLALLGFLRESGAIDG